MAKVKLSRVSGLLFLDIGLWSSKESKYRNMAIMLDTGASVTTISEYILSSLGYTKPGKPILVTTAGGTVKVHTESVERIKIGAIEIENVDVYSYTFPDECFSDGVLGMNVLDQFNFKVDLDAQVIELEARRIT
jgi:aspartyl protease family protein